MSLRLLLSCCGIGRRKTYGPEDETTRLLDPDSLPPALPQPLQATINTEAELEIQTQLRKIVQDASERIISINAPAALLQVRPDSAIVRSRKRSIETVSSSAANDSGWRAINGDTPAPLPNGKLKAPRKTDISVHSLRALAQHRQSTPRKGSRWADGVSRGPEEADGLNHSYRAADDVDGEAVEEVAAVNGNGELVPADLAGELDEGPPPLQSLLLPVTEEEDHFMTAAISQLEDALSSPYGIADL